MDISIDKLLNLQEKVSMALKDTVKKMHELLAEITRDMDKAERGNKAASQRIRTGTIRLEKTAKLYRKESIAAEKKGGGKKPAKAPKATKAPKAKAKAAKPAKKAAPKKVAAKKPTKKKR